MATTNEAPAKQDLSPRNDNIPIMSAPPKDYAPPVKDEGGARKITPLRKLQREQGPEPEWVKCQFCKQTTAIRRVSEPSDEAKCLTLCCCAFGVFRLFLPIQSKWFENIDIHCASCDKHIATVVPDGEVQIVRVPDRPQPTLKK